MIELEITMNTTRRDSVSTKLEMSKDILIILRSDTFGIYMFWKKNVNGIL